MTTNERKLLKLCRELLSCVNTELAACGKDEIDDQPELRHHRQIAKKAERNLPTIERECSA